MTLMWFRLKLSHNSMIYNFNIIKCVVICFADDFPRFSPMQGQILGKRNALSYLGRDKRFYEFGDKYQGIVCECCYHHCSYDELSQYCLYDVVDFK